MGSIPAPTNFLSYQHFKRLLVFHSELLFQLNDPCVVPRQGGLANHWGRLGAVLPNKARIPGAVSGVTVADHGCRTIEKLIDHAVSLNKLYSRAFSIEIEPIRLGNRGYHLADFFDGHGRYAAQSGIFARQFLVAESAVNLL